MRSPYAEVAHFLVVRKMLDRFETIHCYMDGAKELYGAALVAFRDRILACPVLFGTATRCRSTR